MRYGRYSAALLTVVLLHGCGGNDSPTAPTGGATPTPTPTPTPIVVTVTAQVVNNTALQGVRTFGKESVVQKRRVQVTGTVEVTGGSATLGGSGSYTFTPDGNQPPVTITEDFFADQEVTPEFPFPFRGEIDLELEMPFADTSGEFIVEVTGFDEMGLFVDVFSDGTPVTDSNTRLPGTTCEPDSTTICALQNGRFQAEVTWQDLDLNNGLGVTGQVFDDGGFFNIGGPGSRADLLVQLIDSCRDFDHFWVFAAATTDVEFTLTVTDTQTNQTNTYFNPLGMPAQAITDTEAFATCP